MVTAPTWGGNLEVLHWNLAAGRWILPNEAYAGCILLLETSEERPGPEDVHRMLRNMGERGLLAQFPAVVVARAQARDPGLQPGEVDVTPDALRETYRVEQGGGVLQALSTYNPSATAVFGVDFGHTGPQWILPYGGRLTVDGPARRVVAHF